MSKQEFQNLLNKIIKYYVESQEEITDSYLYIHGCVMYGDKTGQWCSLVLDTKGRFENILETLEKIPSKGIGTLSFFWNTPTTGVTPKRICSGLGGGGKASKYFSEEEFVELEKIGFKLNKA